MRKKIFRIGILFVLLIVFACGKSESPNRLIIAIPADVSTFNPLLSTSSIDYDIYRLIYPKLFRERPDLRTFSPWLAKDWKFRDEGRQLLLLLRSDARWSDGRPVTAQDVVTSWQWQIDPAVAWPFRNSKEQIEKIQALNDTTVLVVYKKAYPYQLLDLNGGFILPAHLFANKTPEDLKTLGLNTRPVTCGPFRFKNWIQQNRIHLVRDENFWKKPTDGIQEVVFEVSPDASARIGKLLAGEADLVDGIAPDQIPLLQGQNGIVLEHYPDLMMGFIAWNNRDPLFASAEIRRALTMAINRQAIIQNVYQGFARECRSPILPVFWAYDSTMSAIPFDPEGAAKILREAGWRDRDGDGILEKRKQKFEFELLTITNNPIRRDIAVIVQEQLRRVGVKADIQLLDFTVFVQRFKKGDFQALISAWKMGTKLDLRIFWHSKGPYNRVGYVNPLVDSLLDQIDSLERPHQQLILWHRVQRIIYEDQPFTFLYIPEHLVALRDYITGYQMNFLSTYYNLEDWRIERK